MDEPTEWCAPMVVVPKKDGKFESALKMKPLNECVLREVHPLPKVDETLDQLSGANIFSKLDTNSGLWQIPLAKTKCDYLYHSFRPIQCLRPLPILGQDQSTRKISPKSGTVDKPLRELFSKNYSARTAHGCGDQVKRKPLPRSKRS